MADREYIREALGLAVRAGVLEDYVLNQPDPNGEIHLSAWNQKKAISVALRTTNEIVAYCDGLRHGIILMLAVEDAATRDV